MHREEILGTDWTKVDRKIRDSIRKKGAVTGGQARYEAYRIAFLKWIEKRTGHSLGYKDLAERLMLEYDIDRLAADAVERAVRETKWDDTCEPTAKKVFTEEALASYLLNTSIPEASSTSRCLCSLAAQLLDIKPGENVVDFGCGVGSFLSEVSLMEPEANLYGYDIDEDAVALCQMKTTVASSLGEGDTIRKPSEIRVASMFDEDAHRIKYDKAFSNYPLGLMVKDLDAGSKLLARIKKEMEGLRPTHHSDWVFNRMLVDSIEEGGKAVGIMTAGAALREEFRSVRETFASNGWIEGVVALPRASLSRTRVPSMLVVLSRNNESVKFIDASHFEVLDVAAVESILAAWEEVDSGAELLLPAKRATKDEVEEKKGVLYPMEYIRPSDPGVSLGELSHMRIRKGLDFETDWKNYPRYFRNEIGDVVAESNNKHFLLLTPFDLRDGLMELPYDRVARNAHKGSWGRQNVLREGELVISRSTFDSESRVAVVDDLRGFNVVANAELFVVSLDNDLVDPWYVAAYLDSCAGQEVLKRACSGALMRNLSQEALLNVEIPIPPDEEQARIAGLWKERVSHVASLRKELFKAEHGVHDGLWDDSRS